MCEQPVYLLKLMAKINQNKNIFQASAFVIAFSRERAYNRHRLFVSEPLFQLDLPL
jgi:hypothetical protein